MAPESKRFEKLKQKRNSFAVPRLPRVLNQNTAQGAGVGQST